MMDPDSENINRTMSVSSVTHQSRIVYDPGLCRCCGSSKKCRLLNIAYEFSGQKEIYSDMLIDSFGVLLSHLDTNPMERLICATCVMRLRDACSFKIQVLKCEEAFLQMKMYDAYGDDVISVGEFKPPELEVRVVKSEPEEEPPDPRPRPRTRPRPRPAPVSDHDDSMKNDHGDSSSNDDVPLDRLTRRKIVAFPITRPTSAQPRPRRKRKQLSAAATVQADSDAARDNQQTMSKLQERNRDRDVTYITETNILNIVEYSYVCPFKCRHNNLLCYYCGQLCATAATLRSHTLAHNPAKFKVNEHKKMIKVDITRIDCRLCDAKIDSLDRFKQHITTVHGKKYYFEHTDSILPFRLTSDELSCALCEQKHPYFHALNKHMNVHFSNYVCETCGLGFVDKCRFVMHQQRHAAGDYPCETCGKMFRAQYNRDLHVDRVHRKRGRVYCPKCDVRLMSYPQKLKHLVEVHGEQPLSFHCSLCGKVYMTRRMLTIHRRKDHLKDYRYDCEFCGQKFFTRFALTNHMPTHTGERNFKCKVCEKSYPRLKTLKDHMRIHTNDRRYRCHICGQAFIQNCSLKGHLKSQHPEYG